ncbi:MAG: hypothetical protein GF364_18630 [Candidatus Lokiarchaeota archaeon]|nr:hypothetical protein [Candidatus Lokiarchaeota archaeon]
MVAKKYVDDNDAENNANAVLKASHNLPDGFGLNYQITTGLDEGGSDDLTVTLKGVDGNALSSTNTAYFRVENTILSVSSALSVTVTDADHFTWATGKIQANDGQLFVYIINNNGTAQLGISSSSNLTTVATNYYDDSGQTGSSGHTNIVMSGTRNATNTCKVIGRINVQQASDNDWEAPSTTKIINKPIFETDWLQWTPTFTGFSSDPSIVVTKYKVKKGECIITGAAVSGTSNSTDFSFTAPISCINESANNFYLVTRCQDNGSIPSTPGHININNNTKTLNCYTDLNIGTWTGSNNKGIYFTNFKYLTD